MEYAGTSALKNRWTDIFRRDSLVHLALMASIVSATFQGYLKDRIAGPLPYALSELFFIGAVLLWFAALAVRHEPVRGPGIIPATVLVLVLVPTLYLLHPGTPLLVKLAGLRGWSVFPIACLMALTVVKSPGQLRAYVGLILLLCAGTAVYGILQYQAGPESVLDVSALARARKGGMLTYGLGGQSEFRAVSTFALPAAFAAMMVLGILLAAGVAVGGATRSAMTRLTAAALILLLFAGVVVSGTRAAMVGTLLGLGIMAWYRGVKLSTLALIALVALAAYLAILFTAGRAWTRFESLLVQEGLVWTRVYAPIYIGFTSLADAPFGLGLGRSGVGVPFAMVQGSPSGLFRGGDGDIARAAVELGVFGLLLLTLTLAIVIPRAARSIWLLRRTAAADLVLGIGAIVLSTAVMFLIGTPLSSVPQATIWWFMLGGLFKLEMLQDAGGDLESQFAAPGWQTTQFP